MRFPVVLLVPLSCAAAQISAPPSVRPSGAPAPLVKKAKAAEVELAFDHEALTPDQNRRNMIMPTPNSVPLSREKPAGITKEPPRVGTLRYAELTVGAGPKAKLFAVLDENDKVAKIHIDANRNGDLTDDPEVEWGRRSETTHPKTGEKRTIVSGTYLLPASWPSGDGLYSLLLVHTVGTDRITAFRISARTGKLKIKGGTYSVLLAENMSTGAFDNAKAPAARKPPVHLMIDLDGDGTFRPTRAGREVFDTTRPIPIGNEWYAADFSEDGAKLTLHVTDAPPKVVAVPRKPLLRAGQKAPDFAFVPAGGGKSARLSDHRGKIRIVDMWATWCGPCLDAMPKIESIHRRVKDQDVLVLGLNVMDDRKAYEKWIGANSGKTYHFLFGRDETDENQKSGAVAAEWGVYALPSTFLIDRDGTILLVLQGFTSEGHAKIVELLKERGVKVEVEPDKPAP